MIGRDDIKDWIVEQQTCVEQSGGLSALVLCHFNGSGAEQQIYGITSKSPQEVWSDAERLASVIDAAATRHAKGMPGSQQYELRAVFGDSVQPSRFMPFQKMGNVMGVGPQGLGTEPPTDIGQRMQSMRHAEQTTQMMLGYGSKVMSSQQSALEARDQMILKLQTQNGELMVALQTCVTKMMQDQHSMRMAELENARKAEFQKQLMHLAPALLNTIAGKEIFPQSTEDTSIITFIAENISDDEVRLLTSGLANKPGGDKVAAVLVDRFQRHKRKLQEERAADRRLLNETPLQRVLYDDAEADAMGNAMRILGGKTSPTANGTPAKILQAVTEAKALPVGERKDPPPPVVEPPQAPQGVSPDEQLWDDLFKVTPEGQAEMLFGVLAGQHPEIAARLRERYARSKK